MTRPSPTVILHTSQPGSLVALFKEQHPDLAVHGCDIHAELHDPLRGFETVSITPHCAAILEGGTKAAVHMSADTITRHRTGMAPSKRTDPERSY